MAVKLIPCGWLSAAPLAVKQYIKNQKNV